jgi:hypothetical protein
VLQVAVVCIFLTVVGASEEEDMLGLSQEKELLKRAAPQGKKLKLKLKLKRPKVSRPECLGMGLPTGTYDQIFLFCLTIVGFLMFDILSDEKMGL